MNLSFWGFDQTVHDALNARLVSIEAKLDRLLPMLEQMVQQEDTMAHTLDEIVGLVTAETSVDGSLVKLSNELKAALDAALSSVGGLSAAQQAQINSVFDIVTGNSKVVADAVVANTPVANTPVANTLVAVAPAAPAPAA